MSVFRVATTAISLAVRAARSPAVRAGIKAAPKMITPQMREAASEKAMDAAYKAGALVGKVMRRSRGSE